MGSEGQGKRGGARVIYLCVVIAARIYVIGCYAKNVKTDLTAIEKKRLRQIAAHLKGAQQDAQENNGGKEGGDLR